MSLPAAPSTGIAAVTPRDGAAADRGVGVAVTAAATTRGVSLVAGGGAAAVADGRAAAAGPVLEVDGVAGGGAGSASGGKHARGADPSSPTAPLQPVWLRSFPEIACVFVDLSFFLRYLYTPFSDAKPLRLFRS